jgi:ligand-binding sensor domain-containing protein
VNDMDGRLWVGTEDRGLWYSILELGHEQREGRSRTPDSLCHDAVRALIVDRSGLVWVGTRGGGASAYNPRSRAIRRLEPQSENQPAEMRQMIQARDGTLWLATDGGGLIHMRSPTGRVITRYTHDPDNPRSLPGNRTICLAEDFDGTIWIGTDGSGLASLNPESGRFTRYRRNPAEPGSLGGDTVWALLIEKSGRLWIGLEGGGLDRLERAEGSIQPSNSGRGRPVFPGGVLGQGVA